MPGKSSTNARSGAVRGTTKTSARASSKLDPKRAAHVRRTTKTPSSASASKAAKKVRRLAVLGPKAGEKEKISLTLDRAVVVEIKERSGGRPLSSSVNDLLHSALVQARLNELVDEMVQEAGEPSQAAYDRVFAQWQDD